MKMRETKNNEVRMRWKRNYQVECIVITTHFFNNVNVNCVNKLTYFYINILLNLLIFYK